VKGLLLVVGVLEPVIVPGTPVIEPDGPVHTGIWQQESCGSVVSEQLDGNGGYDGHLGVRNGGKLIFGCDI